VVLTTLLDWEQPKIPLALWGRGWVQEPLEGAMPAWLPRVSGSVWHSP
jgi:hypothetical protein